MQYPAVALAFEKLLLCSCLPAAAMVQVFGVAESLGAAEVCCVAGGPGREGGACVLFVCHIMWLVLLGEGRGGERC